MLDFHQIPKNGIQKLNFKKDKIENICETGPGTAKTSATSIEAHIKYCFYFKWGGCPNELENITDPGEQPHFPVPNNELQGPEIQDPNTDYTKELWPWDIRREMLTKRAAERIKKDSKTETSFTTGSKLGATTATTTTTNKIPTQIQETKDETETEDTAAAAPQPQKNQQPAQTPISTNNFTNCKFKILAGKDKCLLFPERKPYVNRRFTAAEFELEKLVAQAFKRPYRTFVNDPPTYPWLPPEPLVNQFPHVNFKLNFTE